MRKFALYTVAAAHARTNVLTSSDGVKNSFPILLQWKNPSQVHLTSADIRRTASFVVNKEASNKYETYITF